MASEFQFDTIGVRAYLMTDPLLSAGLEELAHRALAEAQSIAPDRTGEYRSSLYVEKHISNSRMSFRVGSRSAKAWWIEYGTGKMPKFAVLRRALDSLRGQARTAADYPGIAQYDAVNATSQAKRAINRTARTRKAQLRKGGK